LTTQAINWYLKRKGPISSISKILRIAAILTGTIGGLLPLLHAPLLAAFFGQEVQNLNGQLGYVFLALAGAFVLADKVFGVSSKWMRYPNLLEISLRQISNLLSFIEAVDYAAGIEKIHVAGTHIFLERFASEPADLHTLDQHEERHVMA